MTLRLTALSVVFLCAACQTQSENRNFDARSDAPRDAAAQDVKRDTSHVPDVDLPSADLPVADLPVADLPVADLPVADLPVADLLPADTVPLTFNCTIKPCKAYVLFRMIFPTNTQDVRRFGYDYNGDTLEDNALGSILVGMSSATGSTSGFFGFGSQDETDKAVYAGRDIVLFEVQSNNLLNDSQVVLRAQDGAPVSCCPGQESDLLLCKATATSASGCFGGNGSFSVAPSSPQDALLGGAIKAGRLAVGPGTFRLLVPMGGNNSVVLNLKEARIRGQVDASGIADGVLTGVIPLIDVTGSLIPGMALSVQAIVADPKTSPDTKSTLLGLFDQNKDGKISSQELASNSLIQSFLGGDVDVDKDGVRELSFGIGFEAVKAIITP